MVFFFNYSYVISFYLIMLSVFTINILTKEKHAVTRRNQQYPDTKRAGNPKIWRKKIAFSPESMRKTKVGQNMNVPF